jgi:hypothetical protein
MSQKRRQRKAEREGTVKPASGPGMKRKILIGLVIVAAFGLAYFLGFRKRTGRLDAFAQCLSGKQAKMYGAFWCPHCADQKELFGSSFQYVSYIECGVKGQKEPAQACVDAGIKHFPTWQFSDGARVEGTQPLTSLSDRTGCSLP